MGITSTRRIRVIRIIGALSWAWTLAVVQCTPVAPAEQNTATHSEHFAAVHRLPVSGRVLVEADIPEENWKQGHRGVDLAASVGQDIRASRGGEVYFAGVVAGTPTISVLHPDGIRTTYEPVRATVSQGEHVRRGQVIGHLVASHETARQSAGLSWGAKIDADRYIDPLSLLGDPVIVLKH